MRIEYLVQVAMYTKNLVQDCAFCQLEYLVQDAMIHTIKGADSAQAGDSPGRKEKVWITRI